MTPNSKASTQKFLGIQAPPAVVVIDPRRIRRDIQEPLEGLLHSLQISGSWPGILGQPDEHDLI